MSEEILEQTAEELEEEQQAVAEESSGEEILDEAKAKVKEDGDEEAEEVEEEVEVEESVSIPKTKAGMIKALYDQLNGMKKADLADSFTKIMGSTLAEEEGDEEEGEEEEEAPMENKKLKKEDLEISVKDDMDALVQGEDLSEEFKTKASTIFEAAVSAKVISEVNQRIDELETNYKKEITYIKVNCRHLRANKWKIGKHEINYYLNLLCLEMILIDHYKKQTGHGPILREILPITLINFVENLMF